MIQAAVYDVDAGQEGNLGHGSAQAEASVVKLDIPETLLARYRDVVSTLPAGDLADARQMMEFSDNTAATARWFAAHLHRVPRNISSRLSTAFVE
jgi:hypothetical protein